MKNYVTRSVALTVMCIAGCGGAKPSPAVQVQALRLAAHLRDLEPKAMENFDRIGQYFSGAESMQYVTFSDNSRMEWLYNPEANSPDDWLFASPVSTKIDDADLVWVVQKGLSITVFRADDRRLNLGRK